ncbi:MULTISPECIES: lysylphosphatidylglycerol synthase transmembrane domain-containing protein [unclassified Halanaerobium]|uniref:lysylphosphatidylglycerol synthase transmembrane domain-containing protein n=1 Tax=unclassified Halanaerobium TaxID=2641197 RepID=UPI000DF37E30|nr:MULTISPECIES: lysylphosphatidylglycerol synthase transmembrane domain-containing protein [unclassified Halanaerobium]RCW50466.1 hypothetical protein DFR78_10343 [Halanaerobium sp. MA284_MarDTE_T2]RCW85953.1 hypothetical protein DER71_10910 [Halanaerobium sp. DL-01]
MENKNNQGKKISLRKYMFYFVLFLIISALTLYYIYNLLGKESEFKIFLEFPLPVISSLFVLLMLYFVLDGLRLFFILKTLQIEIEFLHILKLVFINLFVSNITPLATGGGVAQVYFLHRKGIPLGSATAATTIRTALATTIIFTAAPPILLNNQKLLASFSGIPIFVYLFIFIILYFLVFYIIIFKNRFLKKVVYRALNFLKEKNIISADKYDSGLRYMLENINLFGERLSFFLKGNKVHIFLSVLFTILFLLAEFSFSVLLLIGMGYQINYLSVIFLQLVVVFFMYFAPTPGAAGVAEGGYSFFFSSFVSKQDIFPLLFAWRFLTKYVGIFIGILVFLFLMTRGEDSNE